MLNLARLLIFIESAGLDQDIPELMNDFGGWASDFGACGRGCSAFENMLPTIAPHPFEGVVCRFLVLLVEIGSLIFELFVSGEVVRGSVGASVMRVPIFSIYYFLWLAYCSCHGVLALRVLGIPWRYSPAGH